MTLDTTSADSYYQATLSPMTLKRTILSYGVPVKNARSGVCSGARPCTTADCVIAIAILERSPKSQKRSLRTANARRPTLNGRHELPLRGTPADMRSFSEFNHERNSAGECVLVQGAQPLPNDDSCVDGQDFWYERTPYRKIPYSTCEGGTRPDHGAAHICPGIKGHSFMFWMTFLALPFAFTGLVGYYFYRRGGFGRG